MSDCSTIVELLSRGADARPAIRAPGLPALSFKALRRLVDASAAQLRSFERVIALRSCCRTALKWRGARKPGAVGPAAGPEIAIMDEDGKLLATGETGEIVIRGANVTVGYENNPKANTDAFTNGWFRTGDQGTMDEDGYIRLTGRLKEIINRGGEKISPREVDEILMDHPAVGQVVTFAMPHEKLGEEVAAAVVLRSGQEADEAELREFANRRLAAFKVPRKIIFLGEIPKGATGKLQRIGLAQKLGLDRRGR